MALVSHDYDFVDQARRGHCIARRSLGRTASAEKPSALALETIRVPVRDQCTPLEAACVAQIFRDHCIAKCAFESHSER